MIAFYSFLWVVLCALLQVLVFNHLHLLGGVVLIYLLALIRIPVQINRSLQILMGFVCGLLVDIFSNTPGMHALTCTMIMWVRLPLLHMFIIKEDIKTGSPTLAKLTPPIFIRYATSVIVFHTIVLYLVESFTLFNFIPLILKILITSLLTYIFVIAFEYARKPRY